MMVSHEVQRRSAQLHNLAPTQKPLTGQNKPPQQTTTTNHPNKPPQKISSMMETETSKPANTPTLKPESVNTTPVTRAPASSNSSTANNSFMKPFQPKPNDDGCKSGLTTDTTASDLANNGPIAKLKLTKVERKRTLNQRFKSMQAQATKESVEEAGERKEKLARCETSTQTETIFIYPLIQPSINARMAKCACGGKDVFRSAPSMSNTSDPIKTFSGAGSKICPVSPFSTQGKGCQTPRAGSQDQGLSTTEVAKDSTKTDPDQAEIVEELPPTALQGGTVKQIIQKIKLASLEKKDNSNNLNSELNRTVMSIPASKLSDESQNVTRSADENCVEAKVVSTINNDAKIQTPTSDHTLTFPSKLRPQVSKSINKASEPSCLAKSSTEKVKGSVGNSKALVNNQKTENRTEEPKSSLPGSTISIKANNCTNAIKANAVEPSTDSNIYTLDPLAAIHAGTTPCKNLSPTGEKTVQTKVPAPSKRSPNASIETGTSSLRNSTKCSTNNLPLDVKVNITNGACTTSSLIQNCKMIDTSKKSITNKPGEATLRPPTVPLLTKPQGAPLKHRCAVDAFKAWKASVKSQGALSTAQNSAVKPPVLGSANKSQTAPMKPPVSDVASISQVTIFKPPVSDDAATLSLKPKAAKSQDAPATLSSSGVVIKPSLNPKVPAAINKPQATLAQASAPNGIVKSTGASKEPASDANKPQVTPVHTSVGGVVMKSGETPLKVLTPDVAASQPNTRNIANTKEESGGPTNKAAIKPPQTLVTDVEPSKSQSSSSNETVVMVSSTHPDVTSNTDKDRDKTSTQQAEEKNTTVHLSQGSPLTVPLPVVIKTTHEAGFSETKTPYIKPKDAPSHADQTKPVKSAVQLSKQPSAPNLNLSGKPSADGLADSANIKPKRKRRAKTKPTVAATESMKIPPESPAQPGIQAQPNERDPPKTDTEVSKLEKKVSPCPNPSTTAIMNSSAKTSLSNFSANKANKYPDSHKIDSDARSVAKRKIEDRFKAKRSSKYTGRKWFQSFSDYDHFRDGPPPKQQIMDLRDINYSRVYPHSMDPEPLFWLHLGDINLLNFRQCQNLTWLILHIFQEQNVMFVVKTGRNVTRPMGDNAIFRMLNPQLEWTPKTMTVHVTPQHNINHFLTIHQVRMILGESCSLAILDFVVDRLTTRHCQPARPSGQSSQVFPFTSSPFHPRNHEAH